jgi:methylated-DNA-[protein]-cysteine S-methyltransferase
MVHINIEYHKTKIGELILESFDNKLCLLDFRYRKMRSSVDKRIKNALKAEFIERNNRLLEKTKRQIDEYLDGERTDFTIPILTIGSKFQNKVWQALEKIPYGKTASYLDIAKMIEREKSVKAVANANGANSLALIITLPSYHW